MAVCHLPKTIYRILSFFIVIAFLFSTITQYSYAQMPIGQTGALNLPAPGTMVGPTPSHIPVVMKGIKIFPDNPLKFDFIVDTGNTEFEETVFKEESSKLIKYFLAALTVPQDELWVNLSPYEKDRIIPEKFALTDMGRDLLAQDYILKQLTASLIYPEKELGEKFWKRVRAKAQQLYGTTEVPVNTFNKVWIIPDSATVYENGDVAFITESHLKVMLEGDYLALTENLKNGSLETDRINDKDIEEISDISSHIIREVVLPEIEKEVNTGENFALLRQIYHSMILATWFKHNLKESVLGKVYVGENKISGVDIKDKHIKEKIYQQYLEAFKTGVYNYIKEDFDPRTQSLIPRKYFSGGCNFNDSSMLQAMKTESVTPGELVHMAQLTTDGSLKTVQAGLNPVEINAVSAFKDSIRTRITQNLEKMRKDAYENFSQILLIASIESLELINAQRMGNWDGVGNVTAIRLFDRDGYEDVQKLNPSEKANENDFYHDFLIVKSSSGIDFYFLSPTGQAINLSLITTMNPEKFTSENDKKMAKYSIAAAEYLKSRIQSFLDNEAIEALQTPANTLGYQSVLTPLGSDEEILVSLYATPIGKNLIDKIGDSLSLSSGRLVLSVPKSSSYTENNNKLNPDEAFEGEVIAYLIEEIFLGKKERRLDFRPESKKKSKVAGRTDYKLGLAFVNEEYVKKNNLGVPTHELVHLFLKDAYWNKKEHEIVKRIAQRHLDFMEGLSQSNDVVTLRVYDEDVLDLVELGALPEEYRGKSIDQIAADRANNAASDLDETLTRTNSDKPIETPPVNTNEISSRFGTANADASMLSRSDLQALFLSAVVAIGSISAVPDTATAQTIPSSPTAQVDASLNRAYQNFFKGSLANYTQELLRLRNSGRYSSRTRQTLDRRVVQAASRFDKNFGQRLNAFLIAANALLDEQNPAKLDSLQEKFSETRSTVTNYLIQRGFYLQISLSTNLGHHLYIKAHKIVQSETIALDGQQIQVASLSSADQILQIRNLQGHSSEGENFAYVFRDAIRNHAQKILQQLSDQRGDYFKETSTYFQERKNEIRAQEKLGADPRRVRAAIQHIEQQEQAIALLEKWILKQYATEYGQSGIDAIVAKMEAVTARHEARHHADRAQGFNDLSDSEKEARAFAQELLSARSPAVILADWAPYFNSGTVYDSAVRKVLQRLVNDAKAVLQDEKIPQQLHDLNGSFLWDVDFEKLSRTIQGLASLDNKVLRQLAKQYLDASQTSFDARLNANDGSAYFEFYIEGLRAGRFNFNLRAEGTTVAQQIGGGEKFGKLYDLLKRKTRERAQQQGGRISIDDVIQEGLKLLSEKDSAEEVDASMLANVKKTLGKGLLIGVLTGILSIRGDIASIKYQPQGPNDAQRQALIDEEQKLIALARQLIQEQYAIGDYEKSLFPYVDWNTFIDAGYLNDKGIIQPKFQQLTSADALTDVIEDAELREKVFQFLSEQQKALASFNTQDIQEIVKRLQEESRIEFFNKNNKKFQPIEKHDAAKDYIKITHLLRTKNILARQTIHLDGRDVEAIYIEHDGDPFWGYGAIAVAINDTIFMHVNEFIPEAQQIFDEVNRPAEGWSNVEDSYGVSQIHMETYKGMSVLDIALHRMTALLFHEVGGHGSTVPLIDQGKQNIFEVPMTKDQRNAAHEVSGLLGQILGAYNSRAELALVLGMANASALQKSDQRYVDASKIIRQRIMNKFGFYRAAFDEIYGKNYDFWRRMEGVSPIKAQGNIYDTDQWNDSEAYQKIAISLREQGFIDDDGNVIEEKFNKEMLDELSVSMDPDAFNLLLEAKYSGLYRYAYQWGCRGHFREAGITWLNGISNRRIEAAVREIHQELFDVALPEKGALSLPDGIKTQLMKLMEKNAEDTEKGLDKKKPNNTEVHSENVGGIDLNPYMLELQLQGEGANFTPADLQSFPVDQFEGFSPIIFNIIPTNLPMFIGSANSEEQLQLSSAS